jgi:MFS family permease
VRLKLAETPAFARALSEAPPSEVPLAEVLKRYPLQLAGGTLAVIACFAIFYLTTAFALGYGSTTLGYGRSTFLEAQLGAIGFMALGIVAAGWWSDLANPRRVLIAGCLMTVAAGFLMAPMMVAGSLVSVWAFMSLALLIMGFVYGPLGAFLPHLFPARVRYTGASAAFNVGGIVGGGLAPLVAQALANRGGLEPVGLALSGAALLSLVGILPLRRMQP